MLRSRTLRRACGHAASPRQLEWSEFLARKPNYDFEKRRKEQDRKAKKDAKREDRLRRKAAGLPEEDDLGEPVTETTAETPE